jgi:hypothetical protein
MKLKATVLTTEMKKAAYEKAGDGSGVHRDAVARRRGDTKRHSIEKRA